MAVKLIPNTISVTEQFLKKKQLMDGIKRWTEYRYKKDTDTDYWAFVHTDASLDTLEKECGIRCGYIKGTNSLTKFEMVNEKKYLVFVLRWL